MAVPTPHVAVYGLDDHRLPATVRRRLAARLAELSAQLADGNAEDWADYKARVGHLRGLSDAIDICTEIEREQERR